MPRSDESVKSPFHKRSPRKPSSAKRHALILILAFAILLGFVAPDGESTTIACNSHEGFSHNFPSHSFTFRMVRIKLT